MVPGFDVELDMSGILGVGIRGIWANEGKVHVLIDGLEWNDDIYGVFELGSRVPVELIDRIEIIRGPGAAMYGGTAELGVISIITKSPEKSQDLQVSTSYGRMNDVTGRAKVSALYGSKGEDISYSLSANYSEGNLSDRDATDIYGTTFNLGDNNNSKNSSRYINGSLSLYGANVRIIYDDYSVNTSYPSDGISNHRVNFYSTMFSADYKIKISDKFILKPKFQFKDQQPWSIPPYAYDDGTIESEISEEKTQKYIGELAASYNISENYTLLGGLVYELINGMDATKIFLPEDVSYTNFAAYAQGLFNTSIANFSIGGRFSNHNVYGSSFVPRIGVTKVFGDFHVKLLAAQSLREPKVYNIGLNENIKPEKATIYELEVGAKLTQNLMLSANVFDISVKDVIVYSWNEEDEESYYNAGNVGSLGFEFAAKYKSKLVSSDLTYSFYSAKDGDVEDYAIPGKDNAYLGMPTHKITGALSFDLWKTLKVTPHFVYYGSRHAIISSDEDYNLIYGEKEPSLLLNLTFLYSNLFINGLDATLSVYNLTDDKFDFIEPYIGWDAPLPGPSREFVLKLDYNL